MVEIHESIEQIQKLKPFLPDKTQEELDEILVYGEEKKAEGERLKYEFWSKYGREEFRKLLEYKWKYEKKILDGIGDDDVLKKSNFFDKIFGRFKCGVELPKKPYEDKVYKYLDKMDGLERDRFMEEYLHNYILYSGKIDDKEIESVKTYSYDDWKKGNVVMEEGVTLNLSSNKIGAEGAKAIAGMKLEDRVNLFLSFNEIGDEGAKIIVENLKLMKGVTLKLDGNKIGVEGAKTIARNMKLEEGVTLDLSFNEIGDEGAKELSKMELKEGVTLDLSYNSIGDEGAEALLNMELKDGCALRLSCNNISSEMRENLKEWEKSYNDRGIKCKVLVD